MDPVMLIKIPFIQYLYGIKSMRQTVKEFEVYVAYRWFLGLEMTDKVPHFSTFGKNYTRRFKDTDLFEQIFSHILQECYKFKLIDPGEVFVDATHVKARANNKKMQKRIAREEALFFEELLREEINEDREAHGKHPLKAEYGFKVHTAYIAEVKRDLGLPMYDAPNAVEELKQPRKHPTAEKVEAIKAALKYFGVI